MKALIKELIAFFKNPTLEKDNNTSFIYRIKIFGQLIVICLLTVFIISPIFTIIQELGLINMQDHALEEMMQKLSKPVVFVFATIVAPVFEEVIFRAPLTAFKKEKQFKIGFYVFAILFGLVHITNFKITPSVLLLAPILVLPQICIGGFLGFIRVRFGLLWSIALHGSYNGILMLISFAAM
ncbi:CPBP family intramembrane glutamic endopeptidase [Polaribacter sp.]|uniref:CPBP family intramembrane glutamic endopeptidase n=1 Tax=Polaribacter sp. TaxID=1920175 RepID=UPI003F69F1C3